MKNNFTELTAIGYYSLFNGKEGVWEYRSIKTGYLMCLGTFCSDEMSGKWISFYDDSLQIIQSITPYKNNKANGVCYTYNKDGGLLSKQFCMDDYYYRNIGYRKDGSQYLISIRQSDVTVYDALISEVKVSLSFLEYTLAIILLLLLIYNIIFIKF